MASDEVIGTFRMQIEIIRSMIDAGAAEGDQKEAVKDLYHEAQAHKMQLESALEVSDDSARGQILELIDEFNEIGQDYEQWQSGRSVAGSHHGSRVGSHAGSHHGSSHHGTGSRQGGSSHQGDVRAFDTSGGFGGGFGSDDIASQASPHEIDDHPHREGSGARRKEKKRDKERKRNSDPTEEVFDFQDGHHSSTSGGGFGNTGFEDFGANFDSKPGHHQDDAHDWPSPSGWGDEGHDKKGDVWGAPTGSSGWGQEATATGWGSSSPKQPSFSAGGFGDSFGDKEGFEGGGIGGGFGSGTHTASFGHSWDQKRPSDTGSGGAWAGESSANHHHHHNQHHHSDSGSHHHHHHGDSESHHGDLGSHHHHHGDSGSSHRDRHGGSSTTSHSVAHLQIHRPYSDIAHNKDAFQRNFERSIADALRIDHRRIRVKEIRRGY